MAILQKNKRKYTDVKDDLLKLHKMNKHDSYITVDDFDSLINNHLPPRPSCADCRDQNTARLSYSVRFRDDMLKQGKYLQQTFDQKLHKKVMRIVPIQENIIHIKAYAHKARNAANRGLTLNDNTHVQYNSNQMANTILFNKAIATLNNIK